MCLEFADKIVIIAALKQRLLQKSETEASFRSCIFLRFYYAK